MLNKIMDLIFFSLKLLIQLMAHHKNDFFNCVEELAANTGREFVYMFLQNKTANRI